MTDTEQTPDAEQTSKSKESGVEEKRRPLKTRSNTLAIKFAKSMANRSITPNQISLASIGFAVLAMLAGILWNVFNPIGVKVFFLVLIIIGVQGRLLCNMIDGMVAVEGGKKTPAGELYNDIPDRISDVLIFLGIGIGLSFGEHAMPLAVIISLIVGVVAVMTAYIRVLGVSMGTPTYFNGPMAKPHRMASVCTGAILTIVGVFYHSSEFILYITLIVILIGSVVCCVKRTLKIRDYLEHHAND